MKTVILILGSVLIIAVSCTNSPLSPVSSTPFIEGDEMVNSSSTRKNLVVAEISSWNSFITDAAVRAEKYSQMKASAFSFLRGSAHLYYKDMDNGIIAVPSSWKTTANIRTWIQGDLHAQNLGFFDNKNGTVVFDVNDFDESFVAPFYWDLIRFSASIYLMKGLTSGFNLSDSEADAVVMTFLQSYQDTMTANQKVNLSSGNTSGFVKNKIDSLTASRSVSTLLSEWTYVSGGVRKFSYSSGKLALPTASQANEITTGWSSYCASLGSVYTSRGSAYYTVKDKAVRLLSGLGSLGVLKFYVLIQGPTSSTSDDVILEVKEQRTASMFKSTQVSLSQCNGWFSSQAWRVTTGYKAMLKDAENNAGVLTAAKPYSVKKLSPWKDDFKPEQFPSKSDLDNFARYAGVAIAQAHNRSDSEYSAVYVPYSANSGIVNAIAVWPNAKTTMRSLAKEYAKQVITDWGFFKSSF